MSNTNSASLQNIPVIAISEISHTNQSNNLTIELKNMNGNQKSMFTISSSLTGDQGSSGIDGPVGPDGPNGPKGPDGSNGPKGPDGPTGSNGSKGDEGSTGPQGMWGPDGPTGRPVFGGSDIRLKENLIKIDKSETLKKIRHVKLVQYKYNDKFFEITRELSPFEKNRMKKQFDGFIAQDIEKVYPELVSTSSTGYKSLNYIGIIPIAITALMELNDVFEKKAHWQRHKLEEIKHSVKQHVH